MKKAIFIFFPVFLLLFTSCDNEKECSHHWKKATCTEPITCSECGETEGEAIGHSAEYGTCTRCNIVLGDWHTYEQKDDYGKPTGKLGAQAKVMGNMKTDQIDVLLECSTKDTLCVMVSGDDVFSSYRDTMFLDMNLTIFNDTKEKKTFYDISTVGNKDSENFFFFYLPEESESHIFDLLNNSENVYFEIYSPDMIKTFYFSVNCKNFEEVHSQITA